MINKRILPGIMAVILTLGMALTGCDNGSKGGGVLIPTFTGIADFEAWLEAQPANSADTAYSVKLNMDDLGGSYNTAGSTGKVLIDNSTKYVSLDLSGSTFTSFEYGAFYDCNSD